MQVFDGTITGVAFADGHRVVTGRWTTLPFGAFADVMLAGPAGRRSLLAPRDDVAAFVAAHYAFDEVVVGPVEASLEDDWLVVLAPGVLVRAALGPPGAASRLLRSRPRRLRASETWSRFEDTVARPLVAPLLGGPGVRSRGTTRAGIRERYVAHDLRPVAAAHAVVDGSPCGALVPLTPSGFGFSEFPARPAHVRVTAIFEDATAPAAS
jgi:hypothetical protein